MNKAVFFDRDGVINNEAGLYYIFKPEDFRLNPGIREALKALSDRGYLLIVITNQGGIAKGFYSRRDVDEIHRLMSSDAKGGRGGIQ